MGQRIVLCKGMVLGVRLAVVCVVCYVVVSQSDRRLDSQSVG